MHFDPDSKKLRIKEMKKLLKIRAIAEVIPAMNNCERA
jgi:hypothetical protein